MRAARACMRTVRAVHALRGAASSCCSGGVVASCCCCFCCRRGPRVEGGALRVGVTMCVLYICMDTFSHSSTRNVVGQQEWQKQNAHNPPFFSNNLLSLSSPPAAKSRFANTQQQSHSASLAQSHP